MNSITAAFTQRHNQVPARARDLQASGGSTQPNFANQLADADESLAIHTSRRSLTADTNGRHIRSERQNDQSPSWYAQFGEMTRFVPAEYRNANFSLPALPSRPEKPEGDWGQLVNRTTSKDAFKAALAVDRAEYREDRLAYRAAMDNLRNSLNANFANLPADIQQKAMAAREVWLQAHPAAAAAAATR